jgi:hypothetical protein
MTLRRLFAAALLLAIAGCGNNTKVARQWSADGLKQGSYSKAMVLVLGLPYNRRQTAEDRIVAAFRAEGVKAVRSWDVLPEDQLTDRDSIARAIEAQGVDALFALRVVSVARDERAYEGREQWTPVGTTLDYYGYVATTVALTRKPDEAVVRKAVVESTLWEVASRKLVWSAESESTTASQTITTAEITDDYAKPVTKLVAPYFRR